MKRFYEVFDERVDSIVDGKPRTKTIANSEAPSELVKNRDG